jgi:NADPH-dependent glutamate synthase beta subunit-like oxidoreductase/ferredoxin
MTESSYRVFLPDLTFYQQTVSCQFACPVRTDARAYVNAIARGEYERAYLIARETNPFASTCGWVCGAPCEAACRRGNLDAPIAIRALKRFVNDRYGVFLSEEGEPHQPPAWPGYIGSGEGFDLGNTNILNGRTSLSSAFHKGNKTGKRVAIVGSGPAGLSCAHDLALLGHEVVIYEGTSVAGGMLRLGIPEYRLPRELIDLEIESILSLGPVINFNQVLGKDFSLDDLRKEFDAVFLAIGTYKSRQLNIEGEQFDGVLRAVDFLINVNLGGYNLDLGEKILVIGGGNVAMDVARTAARLGESAQSGGDLETALDVARAARRLGGTREVHCLVVEDRNEMLADSFEIKEAEDEGIIIHTHVAPSRIVGEKGHAIGVETLNVVQAFDKSGRFNPQLVENSERLWECDSVIISIGQVGEFDWIQPHDGLETTSKGTFKIDPTTFMTTAEGVFSGGDVAYGPRLVINAVADGQQAARGIHTYLQNEKPTKIRKGFFSPISKKEFSAEKPIHNYLRLSRRQPDSIPVNRRIGVAKIEKGYEENLAQEQASRCLICTINPIFDGDLCILCNGCVDVCPTDCLKLVPVSSLDGDEKVAVVVDKKTADWKESSAMLLDPRRCIRCGLCADRCPTEAVVMEIFRFTEEIHFTKGD